MKYPFIILLFFLSLKYSLWAQYLANYTPSVMVMDGKELENDWAITSWDSLDQLWLGHPPKPENCSARYKVLWNDSLLFILMEVRDNQLINWSPDTPLFNYPSNDGPEIFIDEDNSGGEHTQSFQAFAYHISILGGNVVDMDTEGKPLLLNHHIQYAYTKQNDIYLWEMALKIYDKDYTVDGIQNQSRLYAGKQLGFTVAYNDSDERQGYREHMIASTYIAPWDCSLLGYTGSGVNCSWQTSSVFGKLNLINNTVALEQKSNQLKIDKSIFSLLPIASSNDIVQLYIYDISGKLVSNLNSNEIKTLDSIQLVPKPFLYMLKYQSKDGKWHSHKISLAY